MSLRYKLILGFLIPAVMLIVAGYWSGSQIRAIGRQVTLMLDDNERSIEYAVMMSEAIERIDSGLLLMLQGDDKSFQRIYIVSRQDFESAFKNAYNNITLPGERETLDSMINISYLFFNMIDSVELVEGLKSYWVQIFPLFEQLQRNISDLRLINSKAMYDAARNMVDKASRQALPSDLIIIAAVVFAFLFMILIQFYVVKPINDILLEVKKWKNTGSFNPPQILTKDEIFMLSQELRDISSSPGGRRAL